MFCLRYKFAGGSTAPLLENPSMAVCIVLMIANMLCFFVSSAGTIYESTVRTKCYVPLWEFSAALGLESVIAAGFFFRVARIEIDSDSTWIMLGTVGFCINVAQVVFMLTGFVLLNYAAADALCKKEMQSMAWFLFVSELMLIFVIIITIVAFYFLFVPSFGMQLRSLRDFK
mmetsp:Transcript_97313/g.172273  ORF Transcript_97313/g.172273 Transcript_97313/m.172273 type:complete len:172 (-) Transcript_97313:87-602(-)